MRLLLLKRRRFPIVPPVVVASWLPFHRPPNTAALEPEPPRSTRRRLTPTQVVLGWLPKRRFQARLEDEPQAPPRSRPRLTPSVVAVVSIWTPRPLSKRLMDWEYYSLPSTHHKITPAAFIPAPIQWSPSRQLRRLLPEEVIVPARRRFILPTPPISYGPLYRIQLRHGLASVWTAINPVLRLGEQGFETDTHLRKIGDGSTDWNTLAYDVPSASDGTLGTTDTLTLASITTMVFKDGLLVGYT